MSIEIFNDSKNIVKILFIELTFDFDFRFYTNYQSNSAIQ